MSEIKDPHGKKTAEHVFDCENLKAIIKTNDKLNSYVEMTIKCIEKIILGVSDGIEDFKKDGTISSKIGSASGRNLPSYITLFWNSMVNRK